jgi:filamentous hemagglutinin
MENFLQQTHPKAEVRSHTMARPSDPNARLAGKRHPQTGVPFDTRGFPIFDEHVIFETRIGREFWGKISETHMREATRHLRSSLERGELSHDLFTSTQLQQIFAGKPRIKDLSWHHHQELGRMQLTSRKFHTETGHIGGFEKWK